MGVVNEEKMDFNNNTDYRITFDDQHSNHIH